MVVDAALLPRSWWLVESAEPFATTAGQHRLLHRVRELSEAPGISHVSLEAGGNPMRLHLRGRYAPERLNLLAMVALMGLFAAAVLYEGVSLRVQPRTAQLAVPSHLF
jgi:hypothetical protein